MVSMRKSSISIDLGDPRTGFIAEALSNKTCVKILDLLATQELTATDIANKLSIPLNTTGYNLEKLITAGLVEKSSNFFWSVKGKKTPVYRVANKRIIISPKRIIGGVIPILLILGVAAILAVSFMINNAQTNQSTLSNENDLNLKQFNSYSELESYLRESTNNNNYGTGGGDGMAVSASAGAPTAFGAKSESTSFDSFASDYSQTNIQVEGVDEIDIVKNDGKYIYTANQNKVVIVRAYPADSMDIVAELEFDNYVNGIFIQEGRLIVIESSYGYYYGVYAGAELDVATEKSAASTILAPESTLSEVRVHIYDTRDKLISNPELLETFAIDGSYYTARLTQGNIYVIGTKYAGTANPIIPYFKAGDQIESVSASKIYYPGYYYDSNLVFTSIMAIDVDNLEYKGDVFLTGQNSVIYVSQNAIYLTSSKTYDYNSFQEDALKINVEILPGEFKERAQGIYDSNEEYYIKYDKIALITQDYFNRLSTEEKKTFGDKQTEAYTDYYREVSKKYEKTIIHKIGIDGLDIAYSGTGEVSGYVLNQFSMDERNGYFRIATTNGNIFGAIESSSNSLYVLDEDLEIVGSVEDIAPGERIYSARFAGDKAYMVTFRQVDPLYVIDLSNPKNPKILGYLKVTGFSNYLQPIGDDLLLGIGREANLEGRSQGLKISLFDVSDFANPVELDKYVVESDWSYSEAEYEHKAVFFDDSRDLLVIPVTYSQQLGQAWEYWQGAFVFSVTDKDVSLKGKIAHDVKDEKIDEYYGQSQGYVQRSLLMDDSLYTISNLMIKANNVGDLKEISFVKLPTQEPIYDVYGGVGLAESGAATDSVAIKANVKAPLKPRVLDRLLRSL